MTLVVMLLCLSFTNLYSQFPALEGDQGMFYGGLGMATIDDESFLAINLSPELSLGKFGAGLSINLLYNTDNGAIRSVDWDEGYDWARLIRYVRYGHKRDNFYTRVGALDAARLGHGFIMNYYTNQASYDQRKLGLALDYDFGFGGFETVTSNLGRSEIFGGRVFVRPLRSVLPIPILKDIAFGATLVSDVDPDKKRDTGDEVTEYGFDVEVPLLKMPMFDSYAYYDYAKINDYGSGSAVGAQANLTVIAGIAEATARLERRWLGDKFLPSYFNAFYEIERFSPQEDESIFRKDESLALITDDVQGVFGELVGHVFNTLHLVGNFQRLDDIKNSGILHLAAEIPDAVPKIAAHATYDRRSIETGKDLFKLDDDSVARVGIGYKIKPYLLLFMDYIYTFQFDEEANKYKAQERFEPKVSFVYNFGM